MTYPIQNYILQAERITPDRVYSGALIIIFILSIVSHLPSFLILIRDSKRNYVNNANIIYRNLFAMDIILLFGFLPFEIYWTLTRQSLFICRVLKFAGFSFFYGGCIFIIILAVDRSVQTKIVVYLEFCNFHFRYLAIFMPFKHLTTEYRNWLMFWLSITWIFSLGIGLWQAGIHRVGPSKDDDTYFLCGAEQSVAESFFVPFTCEIDVPKVKYLEHYCSSFHIPSVDGDGGHQHLHLHEAGVEGQGAGQTRLCKMSPCWRPMPGENILGDV